MYTHLRARGLRVGGGGAGGTPYNSLYGEAPPERAQGPEEFRVNK